jgi:hypothetical protein
VLGGFFLAMGARLDTSGSTTDIHSDAICHTLFIDSFELIQSASMGALV